MDELTDPAHFNAFNLYARNITDACNDAATALMPLTCNRQASSRMPGSPGWYEFAQPIRDKSLFWHRMWLDCGRPKTGGLWLIQCFELKLLITTPFER